ncbi:unnamed protein product [Rhodiola kirilowii]
MAAASLYCSIEMEPRTLSEGQLNQAREIAGAIVNKFERRDAEIIFTEGLKPIHSTKEVGSEIIESAQRERIENGIAIAGGVTNEKAQIMEKPCQCAMAPPVEEPSTQHQAHLMLQLQEPHTAPF